MVNNHASQSLHVQGCMHLCTALRLTAGAMGKCGHELPILKPAHEFLCCLAQGEDKSSSSGTDDAAATELERVFNKADFSRMEVIGQFNLGFIVARLCNDLFILDQHACDEKYNFERLQHETVLNRQPLLVPQPLDLSPSEAIVLRYKPELA